MYKQKFNIKRTIIIICSLNTTNGNLIQYHTIFLGGGWGISKLRELPCGIF